MIRICLFLLIISGCPALTIAHQPVIMLTDAQDQYPLGQMLEYLEDPSGTLTIDDITSPETAAQFVPSRTSVPNLGFTTFTCWVRIRFRNQASRTTEWRLMLEFGNMQHIEYYGPRADRDGFDVIKTGTRHAFATRPIPYHRFVFNLNLPQETEQTIYLRFHNDFLMMFPLTLRSPEAFSRYSRNQLFMSGLVYGGLLLLIAYNLFLWLAVRERNYGYYVGLFHRAHPIHRLWRTGQGNDAAAPC